MHIFFAITFTIVAATTAIAQNDTVTLRSISAYIIPPKHFEYDSINDKISHPGSMATISAREIKDRKFKQITSAITKEYMAAQGFEFIDKQATTMEDGNEAIIFKCKFKSHDANGNELYFIRLMLFTGKESTIWITADFPECIAKQIETPITNSIKTIIKN